MGIHNIVILTGAGISQESGISTFRDNDGLWENHRIEDVASPLGFAKNPKLVFDFYNQRRAQLLDPKISPNRAHLALAQLEKQFKGNVTLITQNVDNLHQRAGSHNIIAMHGELLKARCIACQHQFETKEDFDHQSRCPKCKSKGHLRPHIVWFREMPLHMDLIEEKLKQADLFLCIGTSGVVYPAAAFIQMAKEKHQCHAIEFNRDQTAISRFFDQQILGPASESVGQFVDDFLAQAARIP